MTSVIATFSARGFVGGGSEAPDYVTGLTPGLWTPTSQNTLHDVRPIPTPGGGTGHSAIIIAWNGAAWCPGWGARGGVGFLGAGHGDYLGNEAYMLDRATRLFVRVTDPWTGAMPSSPTSTGEFADGSPILPHTYDTVEYHPPTNSLVLTTGATMNITGGSGGAQSVIRPKLSMLRLDAPAWDNSTMQAPSIGWGAFGCYDELRDLFWVQGVAGSSQTVFYSYHGTTKQYVSYPSPPHNIYGAMARDPVNDLLIYTDFYGSQRRVYSRNPANPAAPPVALTQLNKPPDSELEHSHGWEWSHKRQAFLYWRRGGIVRQFKHVAGNTWEWSVMANSAVSPPNASNGTGPFSRFRVCRWDDGEEVASVCSGTNQPMYDMRIPEAA